MAGKKKIGRQKAIEIILLELEKGVVFTDCLKLFSTKYDQHRATFVNWWKEANLRYQERRQSIQKQLLDESAQNEKERLKRAILTKEQRIEIAANIALGKGRKMEGQLLIPTDSDRLRALDYLSKIEGDYAPTKQEVKADVSGTINDDLVKQLINKLR